MRLKCYHARVQVFTFLFTLVQTLAFLKTVNQTCSDHFKHMHLVKKQNKKTCLNTRFVPSVSDYGGVASGPSLHQIVPCSVSMRSALSVLLLQSFL